MEPQASAKALSGLSEWVNVAMLRCPQRVGPIKIPFVDGRTAHVVLGSGVPGDRDSSGPVRIWRYCLSSSGYREVAFLPLRDRFRHLPGSGIDGTSGSIAGYRPELGGRSNPWRIILPIAVQACKAEWLGIISRHGSRGEEFAPQLRRKVVGVML
jgi:hypothetical protein